MAAGARSYNLAMTSASSSPNEAPRPDSDVERYVDPVIEAYKKDVDRTLIRENLKLTVDRRLQNLEAMMRDLEELRRAMKSARRPAPDK